MSNRIYVTMASHLRDALGEKTTRRIHHDLAIEQVICVRTASVYILNGEFSQEELTILAEGPFSDPISQHYTINSSVFTQFDWLVEVGFKPGVTDNVGRTGREAVFIRLARKPDPGLTVHTGTQYFLTDRLEKYQVETIARELLANELIQTINIYTHDEWLAVHTQQFPAPVIQETAAVEPFRLVSIDVSDEELQSISEKGMLALSLPEMKAVQSYFRSSDVRNDRQKNGMPEQPTNVELEILAQTWSEHCKHKIFNADIEYYENGKKPEKINGLFQRYIHDTTTVIRRTKKEHDFCLSVFKDNAGVIAFNREWSLVFKVETHNSPSALDPYGGALTGIVGVNRDPFGTGLGSRLIANTDVFCFASPFFKKEIPPRLLHPRRVFEGVREGVEHGGNKSGIPTVNGTLVFDDRFLGKPLVYCGTLGIMPRTINGRPGHEKQAHRGDHIIMVGGRIGKDGIHGATFSSQPLHEKSPLSAVQIGDPITQKRMTDFLLAARDRGLYNSITDNGAGGLSSSIGEMARDTNGAVVYLERLPLKYPGLEPWEIFVSEAQERMTVAVAPQHVEEFIHMAKAWCVEATDCGEFTDSGYCDIHYNDTRVARLRMDFMHDGLPKMNLTARWHEKTARNSPPVKCADNGATLLELLSRLNICSKEYVVRQYDHEVQGGSVVKPLCGVGCDGPSDAAVIRPCLDSREGAVLANGIVPRYSDIDTAAMAAAAFDEAVRNSICSGGDPDRTAALDNFCWCDPVASRENPDGEFKCAQLVRANKALSELCTAYGIPLISGKDSMKNDYHIGDTRISIPPTLLISVVSYISDVGNAVTMDLKKSGNILYITGITYRDLGATEFAQHQGLDDTSVPLIREPDGALSRYRAIHQAMEEHLIASAHDCSDGGLGVAVAEMCIAGETGVTVHLSAVPECNCKTDTEILFSESPCRIVLEVEPDRVARFEELMGTLDYARIGKVSNNDMIRFISQTGETCGMVSWMDAKKSWKQTLDM